MLWTAIERGLGPRRTKPLEFALAREILSSDSVLDVGCGTESPLTALPVRPSRLEGVDGHSPAIEASRRRGGHDAFHQLDLRRLAGAFPPRSFDVVAALDVLEHFEKEDGVRFLEALETIAARKVIVFTPNGFLFQGEVGGNPFQMHRSGWDAAEMVARGYRITGIHGWKPLRGSEAGIRFRPGKLWTTISWLSQGLVEARPAHAFQLFCVLDLGGDAGAASGG